MYEAEETDGAGFEEDEEEFWSQVDDLEGVIEGIMGTCTTKTECLASDNRIPPES